MESKRLDLEKIHNILLIVVVYVYKLLEFHKLATKATYFVE
jgi:hypothetical protein